LKISDNHLSALDLSGCVKLRTLYADRNGLRSVLAPRVEVLSLRNQRATGLELPGSVLAHVKRLYLSGASIPSSWLTDR
jgi:Leucine-rich repeat (LRR) protein